MNTEGDRKMHRADTLARKTKIYLQWGILSYFIFLFLSVLIRSAISGITYDEAYTCIGLGFNPGNPLSLIDRRNCIANNHWLNTILIQFLRFFLRADYNEFIIRLPSLCFFAMYLIGTFCGYKRKYCSLPMLLFLVSNYYLLEYYGLARGYGMANTCVFFACLSFRKWQDAGYCEAKHLRWMIVYVALGVFANTIVLLLYPAIGLLCLYRLVQKKQFKSFMKSSAVLFAMFIIFSMIMVVYHMLISAPGKPLYTGGDQGFFDSVIKGYIMMFIRNKTAATIVGVIVVISTLICFISQGKTLLKNDFSIMLILFTLTNILLQLVLHKGYIATRVLLPFYAFIVFCFSELYSTALTSIDNYKRKNRLQIINTLSLKRGKVVASVFLCTVLIASCLLQTNVHSTKDYKGSYKYKLLVEGELLTGEAYPDTDYWERIEGAEHFYRCKFQALKEEYLRQLGEAD